MRLCYIRVTIYKGKQRHLKQHANFSSLAGEIIEELLHYLRRRKTSRLSELSFPGHLAQESRRHVQGKEPEWSERRKAGS